MTNGEKIEEIFPNVEISPDPYSPSVDICIVGIMMMRVDRNWWNAEYKEPTTKNDLGVDCISRQAVLDIAKTSKSNWIDNSILFKKVNELPSVTPQLSSGLEKNSKKLEKDFDELDCISRAEVLKLMKDNWHTHNGDWAMQESMDDIRALPSVTSIRPKGHWICDGKGRSFADYHCSECGLKLALCGQDIKQRQDNGYSLFCGGCGADMRGNTKRKGNPIEGNNESYNCENWIP